MKYIVILFLLISFNSFNQTISLYSDTLFLESDTLLIQQHSSNYNFILNLDDSTLTQIVESSKIVEKINYNIVKNEIDIFHKKYMINIIFYNNNYFKIYSKKSAYSGCYKLNEYD